MHCIQIIPNETWGPIWRIEAGEATRIDVSTSDLGIWPLPEGEDPCQYLETKFPGSMFCELTLVPGEYHPRIARSAYRDTKEPLGRNPDATSDKIRRVRAIGAGQLHALNMRMEQICGVVHPEGPNLQAFGHEIRNVLILACTEVEAQWKGILSANGVSKSKMTTNDYVKLAAPLKLNEYSIDFPYYPWLEPIKPFEKWELTSPRRKCWSGTKLTTK